MSFYFQMASTVGLYSLGINLPFVSIYPLRHKETLFNALHVNLLSPSSSMLISRLFILTTPAIHHFYILLFQQLFQHTSLYALLHPIFHSHILRFLLPILPFTILALLVASLLSLLALSCYRVHRFNRSTRSNQPHSSTPPHSIIITVADRIEEEVKENALKRCQKEWDTLDSMLHSISSPPCFHQTDYERFFLPYTAFWSDFM